MIPLYIKPKKTALAIAFIMLAAIGYSQNIQPTAETPMPNSIISFVPQYLFFNGIRIDYDRRITDNHWIQFAPQFYLGENNNNNNEYEDNNYNQILGAGLHVYHKYYPRAVFEHNISYISYGVIWQTFGIKYDEQLFNNYTEKYSNINKIGADINIGLLTLVNKYIGIDIYAGLGFRYSAINSNAKEVKKFNEFYPDYGYTGNLINLGARISFLNY